MELKQIKNPNAMTATEMAMILAGAAYTINKKLSGSSSQYNPNTGKMEAQCQDVTGTGYDDKGNKTTTTLYEPSDSVSADEMYSRLHALYKEAGYEFEGYC